MSGYNIDITFGFVCLGDIMGSSISGIENLLKMPYGCGEQNMINFAPSMFIRAYLNTVRQLTPSIDKKSIRFMTSGESEIWNDQK